MRGQAAFLSLVLMLVVSIYSAYQLGRGRLPRDVRRVLVLNLVGVGLLWLRTNKPAEGRILFVVSRTHGITAGDLFVLFPWTLAVLVIAAVRKLD